ncbi:MAG: M48 family metallopeptidase [Cytophagales bacterium]|nr:M48 family metallopeptidase [Cytophagales bacterium]
MKRCSFRLLTGLFIVLLMAQCAKVPITGRSQLSLIPNKDVLPMSFEQYEEVKKTNEVITSGEQAEMVKRAGTRIQKGVEKYFAEQGQSGYLNDYEWEYILIKDDETVNAWCMPGGKVAFYTAILPICKDETGLAVVMGHEIAHAIANHGRERISHTLAVQTGLSLATIALGGAGASLTGDMVLQGAGAASNLGILKFSRKHESEADELGLYFMAMAGYDPQQAPAFWERMSAQSGGKAPPEFMSTHPSHSTRISDLQQNMPKALEYYRQAQ